MISLHHSIHFFPYLTPMSRHRLLFVITYWTDRKCSVLKLWWKNLDFSFKLFSILGDEKRETRSTRLWKAKWDMLTWPICMEKEHVLEVKQLPLGCGNVQMFLSLPVETPAQCCVQWSEMRWIRMYKKWNDFCILKFLFILRKLWNLSFRTFHRQHFK